MLAGPRNPGSGQFRRKTTFVETAGYGAAGRIVPTLQMSRVKGAPPGREGLSEAGVWAGGRKPANGDEVTVPLKSGILAKGTGRAPNR
jgi:hypothetical protein